MNYSLFKLELLVVVWTVTKKFSEFLMGTLELWTDNNLLGYLYTFQLGGLEQKWLVRLVKFKYKIQYRPGSINRNADYLSYNAIEQSIKF